MFNLLAGLLPPDVDQRSWGTSVIESLLVCPPSNALFTTVEKEHQTDMPVETDSFSFSNLKNKVIYNIRKQKKQEGKKIAKIIDCNKRQY